MLCPRTFQGSGFPVRSFPGPRIFMEGEFFRSAVALGSVKRYFWLSKLGRCCWHLVGGGQGGCSTPCHVQDTPLQGGTPSRLAVVPRGETLLCGASHLLGTSGSVRRLQLVSLERAKFLSRPDVQVSEF